MPFRKVVVIAAAVGMLCIGSPARCAEAGEAESPFKALAKSIADLHVLAKRAEEAEARRKLDGEAGSAPGGAKGAKGPAEGRTPKIIEIGGSEGRYRAVIRLPNGSEAEFGAGELVPGFGRIKAVEPGGVEDQRGKLHAVEAGG